MVQAGQITPQMAIQQIQSLLGSTYSGGLDTGKLFPQGVTFTQNGQTMQFDNTGTGNTIKTSPTTSTSVTNSNGTSTSPGLSTGTISVPSTGNATADAVLAQATKTANSLLTSGNIPANLTPTPALMADFLAYAHSQADPYTKQLISDALPNINSSLQNLSTQYGNNMAQAIQDFGTNLASEQNTSANSGTAFSGLRTLGENNMVNTTNRTLSSLGSQAATDIGNAARTGAAAVGTANAPQIQLPTLSTGAVSLAGGSRGSSSTGGALSLNYDPSAYTVGSIQNSQDAAANAQGQAYNSAYGTLASQYPGRSMADLAGQVTGAPGSSVFSNLM
jgi:hypothetical protein